MSEKTTNKEGAEVYELGFLVLPSIALEDLSNVTQKIEALIEKNGGEKIDGEEPMKIDLSYPMTKIVGASRYVVNDAYIGWIKFEAESAGVPAIKAGVEKMDELVRSLLIKAPRESAFTFASAREALEEAAKEAEEASEEGAESKEEEVVE